MHCLFSMKYGIIENKRKARVPKPQNHIILVSMLNSPYDAEFVYKAKSLSWNRGVCMASRRGQIVLVVFLFDARLARTACHCFNLGTLPCMQNFHLGNLYIKKLEKALIDSIFQVNYP